MDLIFPRRCIMCSGVLCAGEEVLCTSCLTHSPVIENQDFVNGSMCRLFWRTVPIERAASMFRYPQSSAWRRLVTYGKFGGRRDTLLGLGRMMAHHFMPLHFFDGIDVIVPMPSGRFRKFRRGYNQASILAQGVGEITRLPVVENAVVRVNYKTSQTHRRRWERILSMRDSFKIAKPQMLAGRHILLLDDVCTTGASLITLGETLARLPDIRISILTLSRANLV